ncbi:hypothetical protein [Pimelobacter simplex]|uniref:hypothetical protein n=1 Tax=Nocardioides simplex TaxID=2045 RepID=UPI003AABF6B8
MSKPTADLVLLTTALRHLDPAPDAGLSQEERDRADAAFARIVATPPDAPVPVEPDRPHRRRRRRRIRNRLLVAAGLAGAVGVAGPALLLGGGSAYGTWTPKPEPLTAAAAIEAGATCRAALAVPDRGERVALAERRGTWTYVLLTGPRGEAACVMPEALVASGRPDDRERSKGFLGTYTPDPSAPPVLAPDGFDEDSAMDSSTDEGWLVWTSGHVGSGVTGVTVHTSTGLDIEASVAGGRYAAWWPSVEPSSAHPSETWSYTVHLTDGSTRRSTG